MEWLVYTWFPAFFYFTFFTLTSNLENKFKVWADLPIGDTNFLCFHYGHNKTLFPKHISLPIKQFSKQVTAKWGKDLCWRPRQILCGAEHLLYSAIYVWWVQHPTCPSHLQSRHTTTYMSSKPTAAGTQKKTPITTIHLYRHDWNAYWSIWQEIMQRLNTEWEECSVLQGCGDEWEEFWVIVVKAEMRPCNKHKYFLSNLT